jgi:pimeloyl-ACP methyl ester carboxylesterase
VVLRNCIERIKQAEIGPEKTVEPRVERSDLSGVFALIVVLVALALPAPALGAVPAGFVPCTTASGFYCGHVVVPVDRSGIAIPTTKTITLNVMWKSARVADTEGALFALAGGPGQAATPFAPEFAAALAPALDTRDLIVFDQRGTGASALDCPGAAMALTYQQYVQECASELGTERYYYTSKDSALDMDAVREAVGADMVTVFGVSYGTYVAQLYAKLFPEYAVALVLDSVVPSTGVDWILRSNFKAIPSVLAANCSNKLCRGITRNPYGDLKRLAARARTKGGLSLRYVNSAGKMRALKASQIDLLYYVTEMFSFDAASRARFPAAVRSALSGDPYPLGRLLVPTSSAAVSNAELSNALYLATRCTEESFPWSTSDPLSARKSKLAGALATIPTSAFNPFTSAAALSLSDVSYCQYWPAPTVAVDPTVTEPLPDIPVLVLNGQEDDVTPAADAKEVAALFPQAKSVSVPFTGHSVLTDVWPNASTCVTQALASFFSSAAISSCNYVTPFFKPVKRDPTSLAQVKAVKQKGVRGQTIGAVLGTLSDVSMTELSGSGPTAGLRGGYFSGSLTNLRLRKLVYVPGVVVSGRLNLVSGLAKVTVTGQGARGKLVIRRYKKITTIKGTLDGKRLSIKNATSTNDSTVATRLPGLLSRNLAARIF